jgi:hypothetical protein
VSLSAAPRHAVSELLHPRTDKPAEHAADHTRAAKHVRGALDALRGERPTSRARGARTSVRAPAESMNAALSVSSSFATSSPTERAQTTGAAVVEYSLCSLSTADMTVWFAR